MSKHLGSAWIVPGWLRRAPRRGGGESLILERPDVAIDRLGAVAGPLIRCLFFADRLACLNALYDDAMTRQGRTPTAASRDQVTLILLTVGTLHEFTKALESLRRADVRSLLDEGGRSTWKALQDATKEAQKSADRAAVVRNKVAFHCDDPEVLSRGIDLLRREKSVTLAAVDNESPATLHLALGPEVVLSGLFPEAGVNPESLEPAFLVTARLATTLPMLVQKVTIELLRGVMRQPPEATSAT